MQHSAPTPSIHTACHLRRLLNHSCAVRQIDLRHTHTQKQLSTPSSESTLWIYCLISCGLKAWPFLSVSANSFLHSSLFLSLTTELREKLNYLSPTSLTLLSLRRHISNRISLKHLPVLPVLSCVRYSSMAAVFGGEKKNYIILHLLDIWNMSCIDSVFCVGLFVFT